MISNTLTSDASCKLDVLRHDRHSLGVDCTQISVFKKANHVGFCSFLKSKNCLRLEPQVRLVLSRDFSDEALEGEFSDQELSRLLEFSDLTESNSTRSESVDLLHSFVSHVSSLPCGFVCELLARRFGSCVLACGLLCSCHKRYFEF